MSAALVCIALSMCVPARGGVAHPIERGGQATIPPVAHLADWTCLHNGTPVAGGKPGTVGSGEGPWNADGYYHGGLQFDRAFEEAWGADMLRKYGGRDAGVWTPREQMIVANRALPTRGFTPWPQTGRACGLIR